MHLMDQQFLIIGEVKDTNNILKDNSFDRTDNVNQKKNQEKLCF